MRKFALGVLFASLVSVGYVLCTSCSGHGPTAPSSTVTKIQSDNATVGVLDHLVFHVLSATVTVLDGTLYPPGAYTVTKWPNNPTEPPAPSYLQRITGTQDPCTIKWPGFYTRYLWYATDDEFMVNPYHWCKV